MLASGFALGNYAVVAGVTASQSIAVADADLRPARCRTVAVVTDIGRGRMGRRLAGSFRAVVA